MDDLLKARVLPQSPHHSSRETLFCILVINCTPVSLFLPLPRKLSVLCDHCLSHDLWYFKIFGMWKPVSEWDRMPSVHPVHQTLMCCVCISRSWQKSLEWKGNRLTKQLSNTFYLSWGQIAEKAIHKWACPRFKRCGSKEIDSWTSGLHTFVFLPEAGANYWPSALCKLLSLSMEKIHL